MGQAGEALIRGKLFCPDRRPIRFSTPSDLVLSHAFPVIRLWRKPLLSTPCNKEI